MPEQREEQWPEGELPDPPPLHVWDSLVAADAAVLDVDRLAAYTDGRLSDEERTRIRQSIAESPKAIELIDHVRQYLREESVAPKATTASSTTVAREREQHSSKSLRLRSRWFTAAAVLFAVGVGSWSVHRERQSSTQNVALQRSLADVQRQLVVVQKERLAVTSGLRPYMVGAMSPALVRSAIQQMTPKGQRKITDADRQNIEAALADAKQAIKATGAHDADGLIEAASLELFGGRIDEARQFAAAAEASAGRTPAVLNLLAVVLLVEATDEFPDDAARTLEEATALLIKASKADPAFASPWFNLALLREQTGDEAGARTAWEEYLRREPNAIIREAVQSQR